MKRYLIAGTALLLMAGYTLAQQPPAPPPAPAASAPSLDSPPPPKPHGPEEDGPRGHKPPPPPRGAHIKFEDGDTKVDVRCAEADTTETCANIVMKLLGKN